MPYKYNTVKNEKKYTKLLRLIDEFGGECMKCGSISELHFHHRDPTTKLFDIGGSLGNAYHRLEEEALKCDLLCKDCHKAIHASQHGSISMYTNHRCRCVACKAAWREYGARTVLPVYMEGN